MVRVFAGSFDKDRQQREQARHKFQQNKPENEKLEDWDILPVFVWGYAQQFSKK